jgi:hypothetical protein
MIPAILIVIYSPFRVKNVWPIRSWNKIRVIRLIDECYKLVENENNEDKKLFMGTGIDRIFL